MLYNLLYRSPLWSKLDNSDRNIRILVLGTILYVVAYFASNSQYLSQVSILEKYKKYLLYLAAADFATTSAQMFFSEPSKKNNKKNKKKQIKKKPVRMMPPYQLPNVLKEELYQNKKQNQNQNLDNNSSVKLPVYNSKKQEEIIDDIQIPVYQSIFEQQEPSM